ncbi:GntR family transcriptional regulator [Fusobacterium sp.]|uniref:GntR family transcriptional regulator n=1 Tax=Fusobacterium sp. TaxID=68766 RepID=UPI0029007ABE|nr:GntR family transcriptional regulator [Fusobacterium sp.]MDU1909854.1 GntR family transcriptional regulator [Fusobacterium sp.]
MCDLDKNNKMPLYGQLMNFLLSEIECNKFKEYEKLPSERELCDKFCLSRDTVRQAIFQLEKMGYIYKKHGKGTFVAPKQLKPDLYKFYDFTEEMKKLGKDAASKILSFEIIPADKYIAKFLKIKENSNVHRITRLRIVDSIPLIFEKTYLPMEKFGYFHIDELNNSSLCNILKNRFSVKFSKGEETFYPITPDEEIARYLSLMRFQPVIKIERTTFEDEIPIMFTERIVRGDKFKYTVITSF